MRIQRSITRCEAPPDAVLRKYAAEGAYTDCFATEIAASVPFAAYVEAFQRFVFHIENAVRGA